MPMQEQSLSDKLKSLGVQLGVRDLVPSRSVSQPAAYPIETAVPGEFWQSSTGPVYVAHEAYPADYQQGMCTLRPCSTLFNIGRWADDGLVGHLPHDQFAFLDTETTGLAGGTGTYAFLVGAGKFDGETFRLVQFFMRDPTEEAALLESLSAFLDGCHALVTFNGKAFDVPLLSTRFKLNGIASPLEGMAHLDLLLLARRLWRRRLPSRSLGYLEAHVLGVGRTEEDVPGWYIPEMYFQYLRSGDARPLQGIFYHNAMDILSLSALLNLTGLWLESPLEHIEDALDIMSAATLFEDLGQQDLASRLYAKSLERDLPPDVWHQTLERLAVLHRKLGQIDDAVTLWQQAAREQHPYAYVELAKYYEHRCRDYEQAERWTVDALALIQQMRLSRYERREWKAQLEHRLRRIRLKMGRKGA
jgi:uncharacterized protein